MRVLWACCVNLYLFIRAYLRNRVTYQILGDGEMEEESAENSPPYFESITIEKDVMVNLKAFSKAHHYTVNDILMASLSMATRAWNQGRGDRREWLKYGFTANLRRWWGEPEGTFANYSAILMHEETVENLEDMKTALAATKSKMDRVKRYIGLDMFFALLQMRFTPYAVVKTVALRMKPKLFQLLRQMHAMTNIGIVFEEAGDFGHARATGYSLLAPTFPGGCVVYTITTYKNVTTIYLGCSEDYLTRESAGQFLALWKKTLAEIGSPGFRP